jgi:DNA-3-methyladenine glycosylase II
LINYKYVGQWTIDMILIFTYYRNNILPKTDYGVLKGIKYIYPNQNINDSFLTSLNKKLNDYSTLFTFCMWYINKNIKNIK